MSASIAARIAVGMILAAVPILWVVRHRGARRLRHAEGKLDSMLLLVSMLCSLLVAITSGVAISRALSEQRLFHRSRPITAEVERCHVVESHAGAGVFGGPTYSLNCTFRYLGNGQAIVRELEAGYPASRANYDEWVRTHPPGTPISLRQDVDNPAQVSGLSLLVPATTTSFASATMAMMLGMGSLVLFLLSRMVVKMRMDSAGSLPRA